MTAVRKGAPLKAHDKPSGTGKSWSKFAPYILGSFAGGLSLVFLFLRNARLLVSLGLVDRFYYLILVLLGLSAVGFLFGELRSIARYRRRIPGDVPGVFELGGPIAGFAVVVILGFILPKPASNFPLTVYVHGPAGPQDLLLRNQGKVLLDLGSERRRAPIGDEGQAFFQEVPANFRGQEVNVAVDDSDYERSDDSRPKLDGTSLYITVRRKPSYIVGDVFDEAGKPVAGATVSIANMSTRSGEQGHFSIVLPSSRVLGEATLLVSADGYRPWNQIEPTSGGLIKVVLQK